MMIPSEISQFDATMIVDHYQEVTDELPLIPGVPSVPIAEAMPHPIRYLGDVICDASAPTPTPVKTYSILTRNGPASVSAQGQILEAETDLFRLSNWENGRKNCVGLFDRREVIGLFEIPKSAANADAA